MRVQISFNLVALLLLLLTLNVIIVPRSPLRNYNEFSCLEKKRIFANNDGFMTNCEGDGGDTKQMRDACVGVLSHIIIDVNDTLTNIVSGRSQYHISLRIFF